MIMYLIMSRETLDLCCLQGSLIVTITIQEFSPDDRYIVSADRDFKIRVTSSCYSLMVQLMVLCFSFSME